MLFPEVPLEAWAPYRQRYPQAFGGPDTARIHFGGFLLRSQGHTILVDTGIGSKATNPGSVAAFAAGADGSLMAEFQAAGVRPEDVDIVFLTHLHPDHVGWNLSRGGAGPRATFPRARYVVHRADWEYWKAPRDQEIFQLNYWEETTGPLEKLGVLDLLSGERALTGEITAIHTPGHTPGSTSLVISSAGQRAMILGDVMHGPSQVTEPDWVFHFDTDPALAVQTRKRMIDRAEAENTAIVACHHARFGRVVRIEGRRYWQGLLSPNSIGLSELSQIPGVANSLRLVSRPIGLCKCLRPAKGAAIDNGRTTVEERQVEKETVWFTAAPNYRWSRPLTRRLIPIVMRTVMTSTVEGCHGRVPMSGS